MSTLSGQKIIREGLRINYRPSLMKGATSNVPMVVREKDCEISDGVVCLVCGIRLSHILSHLYHKHGMSTKEYRAQYGQEAAFFSQAILHHPNKKAASVKRFERGRYGICVVCGGQTKRERRGKLRKTCGPICAGLLHASAQQKHPPRRCPECGAIFLAQTEQRYCSQSCGSRASHWKRKAVLQEARERCQAEGRRRRTRNCASCGAAFESRRREAVTCSPPCRNRHFKMGYQKLLTREDG